MGIKKITPEGVKMVNKFNRYKVRLNVHQLSLGTSTLYRIHQALIKSTGLKEYEDELAFLPPSDYDLYSDKKAGKNKTWEEVAAHHIVTPASWNLYKLIIRFIQNNIGNPDIIERTHGDTRYPPFKIKMSTDALIKAVIGDSKSNPKQIRSYRLLIKNLENNGLIYYKKEGDVVKDKRGREHTYYYPIIFKLNTDETLNYLDFLIKIKRQRYKYFKPLCHRDKDENGKRIPNRINNRIFMQMGHALDPSHERVVALREAYFNLLGIYYNLLITQVDDALNNIKEPITDREYIRMVIQNADTIIEILDSFNQMNIKKEAWGDYCLYLPLLMEHFVMFEQAVKIKTMNNRYRAMVNNCPQSPINFIKWLGFKFKDWREVKSLSDKFKKYEPFIHALNTVYYCKYLIKSKAVFLSEDEKKSKENLNGLTNFKFLYYQSPFMKNYIAQFGGLTLNKFIQKCPKRFTTIDKFLTNWYKRAENSWYKFRKILHPYPNNNMNLSAILGSILISGDEICYENPKYHYQNLIDNLGISYENMGDFAILGSIFTHNIECKRETNIITMSTMNSERINPPAIIWMRLLNLDSKMLFGTHSGGCGDDWIGFGLGIQCIMDSLVK